MSGRGEGKHSFKVDAFIHEKGKSNARITHIDIESEILSKIIKPGEVSFVKGKIGGVFIALKKKMIERAENEIKK